MSDWGREKYGDPCRECGYAWAIAVDDAIGLVRAVPDRYAGLLEGREHPARGAGLAWPAGAYVCHVTDNLRIWAERLAGAAFGGASVVAAYDENLLAQARSYEAVPVSGALWSLRRAAGDWLDAVAIATAPGAVLVHPERGEMTVADVVRNNAHDAFHHGWDIERIVGSS